MVATIRGNLDEEPAGRLPAPIRVSAVKARRQRDADAHQNPRLLGPRPAGKTVAFGNFDEIRIDFLSRGQRPSSRRSKRGLYDFPPSKTEPFALARGANDFAAARNGNDESATHHQDRHCRSRRNSCVQHQASGVFPISAFRQGPDRCCSIFEWINRNYFFRALWPLGQASFGRVPNCRPYAARRRRIASGNFLKTLRVRTSRPIFSTAANRLPPVKRRFGARSGVNASRRAEPVVGRPATILTARCCGSVRPKQPLALRNPGDRRGNQERIALAYCARI